MLSKILKNTGKSAAKSTEKKRSKIPESESIELLLNKDFRNKGTKLGLSKNHLEILKKCNHESSAKELRKLLNRTNATKFKDAIINPLLKNGFLELTIPESPKSPKQQYRLTGKFVRNKIER
jgi:hypothetical protein